MAQTFDIRVLADKTGPRPAEGQPWPCAGVEILGDPPDEVTLPMSFIRRHMDAPWLEVVGAEWVERPSRPGPTQHGGVLAVAPSHRSPDGPAPHMFMQAERFIFDTVNHGRIEYRVVAQPDKYADYEEASYPDKIKKFKANAKTKVTPEMYAAGATRVDNFYTCVREG